ncbi:MAG: O-antigen ligase C-terminal domain-containing protein [Hyphomicrobiaceae bacterium]|nr:O-antigen ligase C-terminal domain-containing protein [Hyphomicrobiaceae bacterium]
MSRIFTRRIIGPTTPGAEGERPESIASRFRASAAAVAMTVILGGCAGSGLELPGMEASAQRSTSASEIETSALQAPSTVGSTSREAMPGTDTMPPEIAAARAKRDAGDLEGAAGELERAKGSGASELAIVKERGFLALERGRIAEAKTLLRKADKSGEPDWRVKSALGSAHAASGDQTAAQRAFAAALELAPDHPSVLNNLALSYALDGRHDEAEKLLRRAATQKTAAMKTKQNLALILGLGGKLDEAREVSEATLPKDVARANISYLERLRSGARVSRSESKKAGEPDAGSAILGALDPNR